MDETTSRGDMHVEHHLNTLENHEDGKELDEEAECSHKLDEEVKEAESLNPLEAESQSPIDE